MRILGIEFTSDRRTVAVVEWRNDRCAILGTAAAEAGDRAAPLALVAGALKQAGLERHDVNRLAVGLGPGSYTGTRAAIALAQGWQLAAPVEAVGIASSWALAWQCHFAAQHGSLWIAIDAQREDFYAARFFLEETGPRLQTPLAIRPRAELAAAAAEGVAVAGPGISRWIPQAVDRWPDAATLCRLAGPSASVVPAETLEPIYLRDLTFAKAPPPRDLDR